MKQATSSKNYIAIKVEHMHGQQVIHMKARKVMDIYSEDGSKMIHLDADEVFHLVKSDSLGDDWYYIVVDEVGTRSGRLCSCISVKPCKHEKAVNAYCKARFLKQKSSPVVSIVQEAARRRDVIDTREPSEKGNLNGSRAFSLLK